MTTGSNHDCHFCSLQKDSLQSALDAAEREIAATRGMSEQATKQHNNTQAKFESMQVWIQEMC